MDAPHRYEMSLKKDGLFINLSSDDVYFVSKQMDKWFRILLDDSYVPVSLPKPASVPPSLPVAPASTPVVSGPAVSEITPEIPPPVPVVVPTAPVAPVPVAAESPASPASEPAPAVIVPEPPVLPVSAPLSEPSVPEPSVPAMAAPVQAFPEPVVSVPPTVESVPATLTAAALPAQPPEVSVPPALSVVPPSATVQLASTTPKDDFESVMDTVMRDLEAPPPPLPIAPVIETLYEQSPVSATQPMNLDLVNSLADLCDQAHPGSSEDYLLLAAYYLSQVEAQACFSLKRINANLVKSGLTPVNHSALEAALSRGYLSMVPDLSGTAEVSEYSLTDEGLAFVNQLF